MTEQEIQKLQDKIDSLTTLTESLQAEVDILKEENRLLKLYRFASKSEKWTPDDQQMMLIFDEAETFATPDKENEEVPVKTHTKKKTGRKPIPDDFPRKEVIHDLSEEEKKCSCCGKDRPELSPVVTEELSFIPATIEVVRNITKQYGQCNCTECQEKEDIPAVIKADTPTRLIPGSIASPSLLTHIIISKFCDALPLYRQERIYKRMGLILSRQTMSNWTLKVSAACSDLYDYMWNLARGGPIINMDETTIQVLNERGRKAESNSYMWLSLGRTASRKLVLYNYFPSRSSEIPVNLLKGFSGVLQTDGYDGYNKVVDKYDLSHIGCMAHVRRKFMESYKASKNGGQAKIALGFIKDIYKIESDLRKKNISEEIFLETRKSEIIPIMNAFREWLESRKKDVTPSSLLGKAVQYALNEFEKVFRYLDYSFATPDNNGAENAIRPFVVGRKNWLFSNTPRGAHSSALLYSLLETAKANGINPAEYLVKLLEVLPVTGKSKDDLEKLLPWNLSS